MWTGEFLRTVLRWVIFLALLGVCIWALVDFWREPWDASTRFHLVALRDALVMIMAWVAALSGKIAIDVWEMRHEDR
jgi:hypothetical protein